MISVSILDTCKQAGSNPTGLFVELAVLIEKCKQTVAAAEVDTAGAYNGVKIDVSNIVAKIILVGVPLVVCEF